LLALVGVPYFVKGHEFDDGEMCFNMSLSPPSVEDTFPLSLVRGIGSCPPGFDEVRIKTGWFRSEDRCALSTQLQGAEDGSKALLLALARVTGWTIQEITHLPVYTLVENLARQVEGVDPALLNRLVEGFRVLSADLLEYRKEVLASKLAGKEALEYWERQARAYQQENRREIRELTGETKRIREEWQRQEKEYMAKISKEILRLSEDNQGLRKLVSEDIRKAMAPLVDVRSDLAKAIASLEDRAKAQKELIKLERKLSTSEASIQGLEAEYRAARDALTECRRMYEALSLERLSLRQECEDRVKAEKDHNEEEWEDRRRAKEQREAEEEEEFLRRTRETARATLVGLMSALSEHAAWALDWGMGIMIFIQNGIGAILVWAKKVWDFPFTWMELMMAEALKSKAATLLFLLAIYSLTSFLALIFRFVDSLTSTWWRVFRVLWMLGSLPVRFCLYLLGTGIFGTVGEAVASETEEPEADDDGNNGDEDPGQGPPGPSGGSQPNRETPNPDPQSSAGRSGTSVDRPGNSPGNGDTKRKAPKRRPARRPRKGGKQGEGYDSDPVALKAPGVQAEMMAHNAWASPYVDPVMGVQYMPPPPYPGPHAYPYPRGQFAPSVPRINTPPPPPLRDLPGPAYLGQAPLQEYPVSVPHSPITRTPSPSGSPVQQDRSRPSSPRRRNPPTGNRRPAVRPNAAEGSASPRAPQPSRQQWHHRPTEPPAAPIARPPPGDLEGELRRSLGRREEQNCRLNNVRDGSPPPPPTLADWIEAAESSRPDKRLYHVKATLNDTAGKKQVLIDTGATASILPRSFCEKNGYEVEATKSPSVLVSYCNQSEEALGRLSLPVTIGSRTRTVNFLVSPSAREIILGLEDLKAFEFLIDTTRDQLRTPDGKVVYCHSVRLEDVARPKK